ncbi:trypsin-like serine peptidase [Staphylococcus aureus]|uniref:trypsin-like serine peptidase n=1 Tax=Staphylococcus aureus TaxID=1280 RepID=UPI0018E95E06|nr:trypsin-like serine protease [Staphylococcus aureus]MBJ6234575.1 trypsin-like serine protease [Staphylococcus aureus]MBJ6252670.1 trypsin-like serine protease [Staphylococcus aureus]MBJ6291936.1 trypsin-like serine protease [Staphylococcus aureus]MBJ6342937.1 trypsin-like serine protease [Staphylococcus aureus]MBJ6359626.1 trypsin-like serine protease [Staphylococcus aureus]
MKNRLLFKIILSSSLVLSALSINDRLTELSNIALAEESGTISLVQNPQDDPIGKRVAKLEIPGILTTENCTATMLTPNIGLTAAHCGGGFKQGYVGKVYPAESGLQTPFGYMDIYLFSPYLEKDLAIIGGKDENKSSDYKYYEKTFAGEEIKLQPLKDEEYSSLVGKEVYSYGYPYAKSGYKQYKTEGKITVANKNIISTNMPAYGGQSGSSLFLKENGRLIGILAASGKNNDNGAFQPITEDIARWYDDQVYKFNRPNS